MIDKKQKTAAGLQAEVARLKAELKKKKTLKKITNKKYAAKRSKLLTLFK